MLGTAVSGNSFSPSSNRVFIYEVAGLKQNLENDSNSYALRTSDTVLIQVPYKRMNEEMRRITRMGGKIVNIRPLGASDEEN